MKNITRAAVAAAAVAVGATAGAGPASAASCTYTASRDAGVRENPSVNSVVRKIVPPLYGMEGPCVSRLDWAGTGTCFIAVHTASATDNVGWVKAQNVYPVNYWYSIKEC
jgi:hypothetical protein